MKMTDDAENQWSSFSEDEKASILEKGWCMQCAATTAMTIETGNTGRYGLVLRGKCTTCGGQVSRTVDLRNRK